MPATDTYGTLYARTYDDPADSTPVRLSFLESDDPSEVVLRVEIASDQTGLRWQGHEIALTPEALADLRDRAKEAEAHRDVAKQHAAWLAHRAR